MRKISLLLVLSLLLSPLKADDYTNPTQCQALKVPHHVQFCSQTIDLSYVDRRERFDRELLAMNYMHSATLQMVKRANRYFPIIEPILKTYRIPDDFKYLCCIESSLYERTVSPTGAVGLWQFMPGTAKDYSLQVDNEVDERYHIEKSTIAACQLLRDNYEKFHDWSLAAAAYNAGTKRIRQALEDQRVDNFYDLYLNEETSRYVYRILACKWVMERLTDYGFRLQADDLYQPLDYREYTVKGAVADWAAWAKKRGCTYKQLKDANPWIRDKKLSNPSGRLYKVKLPANDKAMRFDEDKLKTHQPDWIYEGE